MTALFEYLHSVQSIWVDNLEYQVNKGVDLHLGDEPKKPVVKKVTKKKSN